MSLDVVQVSAPTVAAQQAISAQKARNKLLRQIMEDIVAAKQRLLNRRSLNTIVLHRENLYAVRDWLGARGCTHLTLPVFTFRLQDYKVNTFYKVGMMVRRCTQPHGLFRRC